MRSWASWDILLVMQRGGKSWAFAALVVGVVLNGACAAFAGGGSSVRIWLRLPEKPTQDFLDKTIPNTEALLRDVFAGPLDRNLAEDLDNGGSALLFHTPGTKPGVSKERLDEALSMLETVWGEDLWVETSLKLPPGRWPWDPGLGLAYVRKELPRRDISGKLHEELSRSFPPGKVLDGGSLFEGAPLDSFEPAEIELAGKIDPIRRYRSFIEKYAMKYGVDPDLVEAVMRQENPWGNPKLVSPAGAVGLMQLMPSTAKELGVDPYDPEQNIEGGVRHLKLNLDHLDGNLVLAVAGYNSGHNRVKDLGRVPNIKETVTYVTKVFYNYKRLTGRSVDYRSHMTKWARDYSKRVRVA